MNTNGKEKFLTLSAISSAIRDAITFKFGDRLFWIVAEISEMNVRKGHCYLSLVEKLPGNAAPVCELKAISWATKFEKINRNFASVTGTNLTANTRILFQAVVRYDVKWGLSLVIEDIEPGYTVGLLQQERDATVTKLKAEGIFSNNRNLAFPLVPQRVAVISARDSRGYEDFINKLEKNIYGYRYKTTLFTSLLQGDKAASEMVNRLIEIYNHKDEFDLVVIVRGGGGMVDLNCFNDYKLSRAVARFPLPVLTGIGHTTNISVVDEVAFADRITPTDAADFIVEKTRKFEEYVSSFAESISNAYQFISMNETAFFSDAFQRLRSAGLHIPKDQSHKIDDIYTRLQGIVAILTSNEMNRIGRKADQFAFKVKDLLFSHQENINWHERRTLSVPVALIEKAKRNIDTFELAVKHLDPVNVLKRGFSITMKNGKAVKTSAALAKGDMVKTIFYEGTADSEIR